MLRMLLKRAACFAVILLPVLSMVSAQASTISDAFNSLLNSGDSTSASVAVNQPGYYSSEVRNSFVGGGLDVRFPSKSIPSIINTVPFQFSAGCGGISYAFGGFSFISGDQIKQLIRSVAQDSVGMAVELVMTTLCGPCASVMQVMRQLAIDASGQSIDACHIATELKDKAGSAMQGDGWNPDMSTFSADAGKVCGLFGSVNNMFSDYSEAEKSECSNLGGSVSDLTSWFSSAAQKAGGNVPQTLCRYDGPCNVVWNLMNETPLGETPGEQADINNIRAKLLIMNVMGTSVITGGQTTSSSGSSGSSSGSSSSTSPTSGSTVTVQQAENSNGQVAPGPHAYAPTLGNLYGTTSQGYDLSLVFKVFMCGATPPSNVSAAATKVVQWYCDPPKDTATNSTLDLSSIPIWDCTTNGATNLGAYNDCNTLVPNTIGGSLLNQDGYLPLVANLLESGVDAIRSNQPLSPYLISLIQQVPVPIYQAINVAAVYPDAGGDLVSVISVEVAELLTYSHIRDIIAQASRFQQTANLQPGQMERVYSLLSAMRSGTRQAQHNILTQMTLENELMQQIRELNVAMQRDVIPPDLLTNHNYGVALAGGATGQSQ